ncbi:hypothetical protein [Chlorogloeopsis sp. ULAP02]|uniref:hypothetical protein n=1 Tax=Chlorogloeopsis sp. ULAP02 TaxID=3107926 RepID=UPI00313485AA
MSAKDEAGKVIVQSGATIGGAVGGAIAGAAINNVAAASAATASWAAGATGPFAVFSNVVFHPAAWAVVLANPVCATVIFCGLTGVGAFGAYKLTKATLK